MLMIHDRMAIAPSVAGRRRMKNTLPPDLSGLKDAMKTLDEAR